MTAQEAPRRLHPEDVECIARRAADLIAAQFQGPRDTLPEEVRLNLVPAILGKSRSTINRLANSGVLVRLTDGAASYITRSSIEKYRRGLKPGKSERAVRASAAATARP